MKTYWKLIAAALIAGSVCATSCDDNDDNGGGAQGLSGEIASGATLEGNVVGDTYLLKGASYKLSGGLHVKAGATLHIAEGVEIVAVDDSKVDYILVEQDAKIDAEGTASSPIVMTSELKKSGAWGGIHICGRAHTNAGTGVLSEIGNAPYGGSNDADNSGVLRYIRLEYTGFAFDEEHEANGVSFYGVGNGTEVEYLQAYMGSDDGFEFFGGSVNVSNMVVVSCSDDSFDWTEGWNGKGTDLVAYQEAKATLGYDCDCLIEADNNENDNAATPVSHPVLKNLILAGNGESKQGIRLRRGTQADIDNAKVCGKGQPLVVESALTNAALKNGTSRLTNMTVTAALKSDGDYTNDDFTAVTSNKVDATLSYTSFDAIKAACDWMKGNWIK